jgi:hypothetical protein
MEPIEPVRRRSGEPRVVPVPPVRPPARRRRGEGDEGDGRPQEERPPRRARGDDGAPGIDVLA